MDTHISCLARSKKFSQGLRHKVQHIEKVQQWIRDHVIYSGGRVSGG